MKLLITGTGGQLGKEWVDFCKEQKIDFKSYSSSDLDITDHEKVKEVLKKQSPDFIINCAAYTKVDQAEDDKELATAINSTAVKSMATVCEELGVTLVHFSTDYVFEGTEIDRLENPEGYHEDHKTNPINVYGYTKWDGEKAIKESGCKYLIFRVSWLCGKYGNNFVKTMLKLGSERNELSVVNDQLGVPTFAHDVVSQTFELIKQNESGIFHIGSKGIISWYEFAKEIFEQSGIQVNIKPVKSTEFPTKARRPAFSKLNTQKISKIESVEITDWKVGLKKLLADLG